MGNLGVFVFGTIEDVTGDDWQRVLGVNVVGAANTVKHTIPHMKAAGGGAIVNIASVSSFIAQPAFVPYNSSKGALLQLTRCLALDLGKGEEVHSVLKSDLAGAGCRRGFGANAAGPYRAGLQSELCQQVLGDSGWASV